MVRLQIIALRFHLDSMQGFLLNHTAIR
uniref:Uncharacterized protein n=1 Tax=Rhizophora mucronata TaxID=61149 RepID=A0A2P2QSN0_RHIMU